MQDQKEIVVGDYIDKLTGIRFIEDIRGNFHCCYMNMNMDIPQSNITVEPPVVNIPAPVVNVETKSPVTNNYNTTNNTNNQVSGYNYANAQLVLLQSNIKGFTWPSATAYNKVANALVQNTFLTYTVPFGKNLHILSIVMSQFKNGESDGISFLGIHKDNNLLLGIPFASELAYSFESPLILPQSTFLELKFLPFDKKVDLGITMIGYSL